MSSQFYKKGLRFECARCSKCCRFDPGFVFLSQIDIYRISRLLGLEEEAFIKDHCREINIGGFKRLSLNEKDNYDCVYWSEGGCEIYDARPLQCRSYPFWPAYISCREDWDAVAAECPGVGRGKLHSKEEIDAWLQARLEEPFVELE